MSPSSSHLPDPNHPNEERDFSGNYQTPPTHPSSSQSDYSVSMTYGTPSSYYPGTPSSYPQSMPSRVLAPAPSYSFNYSSTMPGPSAPPPLEGSHSSPQYVGAFGGPGIHRGDGYYYPQPPMSETSYAHQYMPFRQTQLGLSYTEVGQPPSPHTSTGSSTSQRPSSPDQRGNDHQSRRVDEARYGSIANNYRHIITTVSQASPSPSTDSSSHSFERPVVDDMLHRAVEGLRHLDPSRAERYSYSYDPTSELPSGVVTEAPAETVFVQYYEDGRSDVNPTKKRSASEKALPNALVATQHPLQSGGVVLLAHAPFVMLMKKRAKDEDRLSVDPPRRARSGGRSRQATEESEGDHGAEQGSDEAMPPTAGTSKGAEPGYPP
ncbi:GATA type zinc finger [Ceratobasidium sp. AG-Ba]|nr:GATA type zinc finger [Ceratobasidium sp. AG-Ba]